MRPTKASGLSPKSTSLLNNEFTRNLPRLAQPVKTILADKRCRLRRPIPLTIGGLSRSPHCSKVPPGGHCEGAAATVAISQYLGRVITEKNGEIAALPLVARNDGSASGAVSQQTFVRMGAPSAHGALLHCVRNDDFLSCILVMRYGA